MADISIPKSDHDGLRQLLALSNSQFDELTAALRDGPLKFYKHDLERALEDRVNSIPGEQLRSILAAAWSAALARSSFDIDLDAFADQIAEATTEEKVVDGPDDGTKVAARLHLLLELPTFGLPPKARTLLAEGHVYCHGRIVTDVRPIFGSEETVNTPTAAMVIHNLNIRYHEGDKIRSVMVQLDSEDLQNLAAMLDRAKQKQEKLSALLQASGIARLDI